MEIKVKITKILDVQSGTSKDGNEWKKITFVGETEEKYNNLYAFDIFGAEKVDNFQKYNKVGQDVEVSFNVKCNEWKGKYFTSLDAWKVFSAKDEVPAQESAPIGEAVEGDDLPF